MSSVSKTPFADPLWLNRYYSPYYNESHRRLQREVREYVDTHIAPFCEEWEKQGFVPQEVCCSFPMDHSLSRSLGIRSSFEFFLTKYLVNRSTSAMQSSATQP